ncbi:glycoside hydrolase, partial [Fistulina hepatica ATCC 64428]
GLSSSATSTESAARASICPSATSKFTYYGVNESGAEFAASDIPGVLNVDYAWPSPSSIDYFLDLGFNTFRVPFLMERLSPPANGLTGDFDDEYLGNLTDTVEYITGKGGYALVDPHNYMIYDGSTINSTTDFQTWWENLAGKFSNNSKVIFDMMNEPHSITATQDAELAQAAIDGIRASGATNVILLEGTSYTGAWTWTTSGNSEAFAAGSLTDPANNTIIEMHQYLDSDGSGTSETCVNNTIGASRIADATTWLQQQGLKGFLGEFGGGNNTDCIEAIQGMLCAMQETDVWVGALWWAAGPFWGDYFLSIEPPDGAAIADILPQALEPFL